MSENKLTIQIVIEKNKLDIFKSLTGKQLFIENISWSKKGFKGDWWEVKLDTDKSPSLEFFVKTQNICLITNLCGNDVVIKEIGILTGFMSEQKLDLYIEILPHKPSKPQFITPTHQNKIATEQI
jgi:hypothetical protein